jgi:hypothetical protein
VAPASRADDDKVARRRGKPIDVIILDSLAANVTRFTVAESTLLRKDGLPRGDAIAREVRHSRVGSVASKMRELAVANAEVAEPD